jgi:GT2 family glycosyltransferase
MKRIALLVPTYNSAATIGETLRSVRNSNSGLDRITVLCIADDASSDATLATVREVWDGSTPFEILGRPQNVGQWKNVNAACETLRNRAEWILILHGDDVAKPAWLPSMLQRIDACSNRVATICSSWDNWSSDGSVSPGEDDPSRCIETIAGSAESVRATLKRGCWWHISGSAIRSDAFADIGPFDPNLSYSADYDWLLRLLRLEWSVDYVPRTLIRYRQHAASVSSRTFQRHLDILESLEILRKHGALLSPEDWTRLHQRRLNWCWRRAAGSLLRFHWPRAWRAIHVARSVRHSARLPPASRGSGLLS